MVPTHCAPVYTCISRHCVNTGSQRLILVPIPIAHTHTHRQHTHTHTVKVHIDQWSVELMGGLQYHMHTLDAFPGHQFMREATTQSLMPT